MHRLQFFEHGQQRHGPICVPGAELDLLKVRDDLALSYEVSCAAPNMILGLSEVKGYHIKVHEKQTRQP
jgi:hypothetical protein